MFRAISGPVPAWDSLLPPELLRLPEELARVDALLDDPAFFAPFAPHFHPVPVRPAVHPDRVLPAADVRQVPVPAGL